MTTTVRSISDSDEFMTTIAAMNLEQVSVTFQTKASAGGMALDRAEFLDAVAAELDVIIIPRADLPKVVVDGDTYTVGSESWASAFANKHPQRIRRAAMEYLALAEHLAAKTPVDEAEVNTLAEVIRDAAPEIALERSALRIARRLLATGRVTVKEA